jgi:hypothetical protein
MRWGGVLMEGGAASIEIGEEFSSQEMQLHIEAKEALAVTKVISAVAAARGWAAISGKRADVWIDNLPLVFALAKGSSKMEAVHREVERLFWWKLTHHFTLSQYGGTPTAISEQTTSLGLKLITIGASGAARSAPCGAGGAGLTRI